MDDQSCCGVGSCGEKEADLSVSEAEDVGDISWSRLQRNLDEINNQDDDQDEEQPSIHIDEDELDIGELTFGSDDLDSEANGVGGVEESVGSARAARLIQQASSIRRVASATRSTSSSSNTALLESPASRSSPVPTPRGDEEAQEAAEEQDKHLTGRLVEPDELRLIIENDEKCAICLEEFKAEQFVREINCKHTFHIECIDTWLVTHLNCPVCRNRLAQDDENVDENDDEALFEGGFSDLIGEAITRQITALVNGVSEAAGTVLRVRIGGFVVDIHVGSNARAESASPAMLETTATEEPSGTVVAAPEPAIETEALEPGRRRKRRGRRRGTECLRGRRERLSRKTAHFSNYARLNRFRLN